MKKNLLFILLAGLTLSFASAQKITREKVFPITGYSPATMGYPFKIVPGKEGNFIYIEYWTPGEGRRSANYYLQQYNDRMEELWFAPVTKEGSPKLKLLDLFRTDEIVAVVGTQYSVTTKTEDVKVQFFGLDGKEKGALQKMSLYDKKCKKGFENEFAQSPDKSQLLWMGHNPTASAKKRREFVSVWSKGAMVWGKELTIPHVTDGKYRVKQVLVDNKSNAYFLLQYELSTNTIKDTANLPIILRYDYREKKFTEHVLKFPGNSVPEIKMHLNQKGQMLTTGILSDGTNGGFLNGAKAHGTALRWNKIFYKQFDIERELTLSKEYLMDIPQNWVDKYGQNGANFSKSEIVEHGNRIYWINEEFYNQMHNDQLQFLFYDIATVAIDMTTGKIDWANNFEKRQRDYKSGHIFSYTQGISGDKLNLVYLSDKGAQGKLMASSFDLNSGAVTHKDLALNDRSTYMFFPRRSAMVDANRMILMGVGEPTRNEYNLIEITF
jgi:hypothetical protein